MFWDGVAVEFVAGEEGEGAGVGEVVQDEGSDDCPEFMDGQKGFDLHFLKDPNDYMRSFY